MINQNGTYQEHESEIHDVQRTKFMTFLLGEEQYGLPLNLVKEVMGITTEITSIPDSPESLKGVINLRGKIIPIIDLRIRFHLKEQKFEKKKTSIIIIEEEGLTFGVIIDEARSVCSLENSRIEEDHGHLGPCPQFVTGVARLDDRKLIILVDILRSLHGDEWEILKLYKKKDSETEEKKSA